MSSVSFPCGASPCPLAMAASRFKEKWTGKWNHDYTWLAATTHALLFYVNRSMSLYDTSIQYVHTTRHYNMYNHQCLNNVYTYSDCFHMAMQVYNDLWMIWGCQPASSRLNIGFQRKSRDVTMGPLGMLHIPKLCLGRLKCRLHGISICQQCIKYSLWVYAWMEEIHTKYKYTRCLCCRYPCSAVCTMHTYTQIWAHQDWHGGYIIQPSEH